VEPSCSPHVRPVGRTDAGPPMTGRAALDPAALNGVIGVCGVDERTGGGQCGMLEVRTVYGVLLLLWAVRALARPVR